MQKVIHSIGLMSGTSLDGLDIAYCRFELDGKKWKVQILEAETLCYNSDFQQKLSESTQFSGIQLRKFDVELGHLFGKLTASFIDKHHLSPDFVASHGHTIFHNPAEKYTLQIADGSALASYLECPLVYDFRSFDVALGGQGAPLVPIGDKLLFSDYQACLNLGGFSNISFDIENQRIAFDICPVNIVLNELCHQIGLEYDNGGELAKNGNIVEKELDQLNGLQFYVQSFPKSLGKEWVTENVFPILRSLPVGDALATFTEHISVQISNILNRYSIKNLLITGGGSYNTFLIDKLREKSECLISKPDNKMVDFKEAMIFAFLGLLRMECKNNVLASVTGASHDHCSGSILLGKR